MYTLILNYFPNLLNNGYLNVFRYITARSGMALFLSTLLSYLIMPHYIEWCKKIQNGGQPLRDKGLTNHISKIGTPTMGGVVIILVGIFSTLLFGNIKNHYILMLIFVTLSNLIIGAVDDIKKLQKRTSAGLSGKRKLFFQIIIATILITWVNYLNDNSFYQNELTLPFFKNLTIKLGFLYFIFRILVIVGSSNAVNITDGLDGLAIIPVIINLFVMIVFSYLIGHAVYSKYLLLHHISDLGEICILLSSVIGSSLGFLWYNIKPASIFMGDTGSLSLGSLIGSVAVITKNEILLGISGFVFVIETCSVILQVLYFKKTKGKRLFRMAPIHHHFEKIGWSEMQVVVRCWIIAIMSAVIAFSALKLR